MQRGSRKPACFEGRWWIWRRGRDCRAQELYCGRMARPVQRLHCLERGALRGVRYVLHLFASGRMRQRLARLGLMD